MTFRCVYPATLLCGCLLTAGGAALAQDDSPFGPAQPARTGQLSWVDDERLTLPEWAPETPDPNAFSTYQATIALCGNTGDRAAALSDWAKAVLAGDKDADAGSLAVARQLVAEGEEGLAKLHEAADQAYLAPGGRTFETLLPWLARYREMARFARIAAIVAYIDGDYALAFQRVEDVEALGVKSPRGGTLIDLLVGYAVLAVIEDVDLFLILESDAPSDLLARHARRLSELRADFPLFGDTMLVESGSLLRVLREMAPEELAGQLELMDVPVDGNRDPEVYVAERLPDAILWIEDRFARIVQASREPWGGIPARSVVGRAQADAEASGDAIITAVVPALTKAYDRHLFAYARLAGSEAAAAVEAYRLDNGAYPESLESLCPAYLDAVPIDPCSGKGLCYAITDTGYTIYSIGLNGSDDGGTGIPPRRDIGSADVVLIPLD